MTRPPTAPPPARPWAGRLHLALTTLLVVAAVSVVGLAAAGRVKFGPAPVASGDPQPKADEGRYQIEKVHGVHEILDRAGRSFFETETYDTWAFEYKGGLIETTLEAELGGETVKLATLPVQWDQVPLPQKTLGLEAGASMNFRGYIVLSARRPFATVPEMLAPYHPHLGGVLAFGSQGPLAVIPPLFLEVRQMLPYRVFVTASPPPDVSGGGFNLFEEKPVLVSTPLVLRNPALEEARFGGGKRLAPGKKELLLDRQRGYGRIRLEARFLTDDEARELLPK